MDDIAGPPEKIFSVDEANQLLPQVKSLIEQLQGLQSSILKTDQELSRLSEKLAAGNGYPIQEIKQEIQRLTEHQLNLVQVFETTIKQLEKMGCFLKDVGQGLVDFYTIREGELIFLCWHLGEDKIRFWHRPEDGFPGRQPLS